ncbi:hypothetical protein Tco_1454432 [Tanacetum coccineum]
MDKGPLCRIFVDHLATPGQFACLRSLLHEQVFDRVNMVVTCHITMFSEIRWRVKHYESMREKLERRLARREAMIVERDGEISCLRKLMEEKPSGELTRLRLGERLNYPCRTVDGEAKVKKEFAGQLASQ